MELQHFLYSCFHLSFLTNIVIVFVTWYCSWLHLCSLEFSLRQHKKNISKTILFMVGSTSTSSLIINTSKHWWSWFLCYLALRYFLRVSIIRRISDISKELDLAVHTLASFPEMNNRYVQGFFSFISELSFLGRQCLMRGNSFCAEVYFCRFARVAHDLIFLLIRMI